MFPDNGSAEICDHLLKVEIALFLFFWCYALHRWGIIAHPSSQVPSSRLRVRGRETFFWKLVALACCHAILLLSWDVEETEEEADLIPVSEWQI